MADNAKLKATASVKLTKLDESGEVLSVEEHEVALTEKEAEEIWRLRQQV